MVPRPDCALIYARILFYVMGGWRASQEELRRCATIAFTV